MTQLRTPTNPATLSDLLKCGTPAQQKRAAEVFQSLGKQDPQPVKEQEAPHA